jgi:hypothetical protein
VRLLFWVSHSNPPQPILGHSQRKRSREKQSYSDSTPHLFLFFCFSEKKIIIIIKEFPFLCFFVFFLCDRGEETRGEERDGEKKCGRGRGQRSVGCEGVCGVDMSGVLFWVWATP